MRSHFRAAIALVLAFAGALSWQPLLCGKEQRTSGDRRLASVDGVPITETQARMDGAADLDSLELQMLRAKAAFTRREHEILQEAAEHLVQERLITAEAARRGITEKELLTKEIQENLQEPTGEEIKTFYAENKNRITKSLEEATPQIAKYLKQRKESDARAAFLKGLEKEHTVIRSFDPLRFGVDAPGRPSVGPVSAPVVLVLFSDFQCPYCKSFSATLKEVIKHYGDEVRLVFRQYPLTSIHPFAQRAAEASLCAEAQNRFWEMHDLLFQSQNALKEEDLMARAGKLGLDTNAFSACLDSVRIGSLIHEDIRAGAAAGVDGTPTLFINGRYLNGVRPYGEVAAIIDEELKNKK
jgi:protein-disulfide isomerase